jgi:hypothetical protein
MAEPVQRLQLRTPVPSLYRTEQAMAKKGMLEKAGDAIKDAASAVGKAVGVGSTTKSSTKSSRKAARKVAAGKETTAREAAGKKKP